MSLALALPSVSTRSPTNAMTAGKATAFAPASVGNIGVGFDLLGHTIAGPGDRAQVTRIPEPVVRITSIEGDVEGASQLPLDAASNTAGRSLIALRERHGIAHGFELRLHKGIPLGSGLGGSAASCVAALVAANAVLDAPLTRDELYPLALIGEGTLAIEMAATVNDLAQTVHPHPTLSETLMEAAEAFFGHATHTFTRKRDE